MKRIDNVVGDALRIPLFGLAILSGIGGCGSDSPGPSVGGAGPDPRTLSGGDLTIFDATSQAFSQPAPNLSAQSLALHLAGDVRFEDQFVTAGNPINPGLGPIFNNDACISCHNRDGRGRPVDSNGNATDQIFLRLSMSGNDPLTGGPLPVPGFGVQLQTRAVFGVAPEAKLHIGYQEVVGQYGDGGEYRLLRPAYTIANAYIPLPTEVMTSPRVAPPVHGMGLLEAIPEADIRGRADPSDSDGDGISGRVNEAWNVETGRIELGRFGWKANTPTLRQQNAAAYNEDIGVTTPTMPVESSAGQLQFDGIVDDPELEDAALSEVTFYVATLAVPARRDVDDPAVSRGEELFNNSLASGGASCASCHVPTQRTAGLAHLPAGLSAELADQTIHPYTDLLLHDMGDGLADGRPDFLANGREWRTPPLWGIGLTPVVNGHTRFLHDGRARSVEEAILWHGGEAQASSEAFRAMPKADRDSLIAFLMSL